jgi:hypothetical protein
LNNAGEQIGYLIGCSNAFRFELKARKVIFAAITSVFKNLSLL